MELGLNCRTPGGIWGVTLAREDQTTDQRRGKGLVARVGSRRFVLGSREGLRDRNVRPPTDLMPAAKSGTFASGLARNVEC
jgi:hypothetical protein